MVHFVTDLHVAMILKHYIDRHHQHWPLLSSHHLVPFQYQDQLVEVLIHMSKQLVIT